MNLFQLGQTLKLARIQQSLTQLELATRTGISLSTISGLERGTLLEIGIVKLLQLFSAVGLELQPSPLGHRRTLDDVHAENKQTILSTQLKFDQPTNTPRSKNIKPKNKSNDPQTRQRVRHTKSEVKK